MTIKRNIGIQSKRNYGLLFISPWIIGFICFTIYPFLISIVYSFTNFDMFTYSFVGLSNYRKILTDDPIFWESLKITLLYTIVSVPAKLTVALFLALLLAKSYKSIGIFRTAFYFPTILGSSVSLAILWKYLFKSDGLINMFLIHANLNPIDWLGSPDIALFTLMLLPLWQLGSPMVIFLAALQTVPKELLEAARIDGAGKFRVFFMVKLPLITSVLLFNLIMQTIELIQLFTPAFIITQGGPIKATYLYTLMVYDASFRDFKMGYASALSWILFFIIILYTLVLFKNSQRWVFYEDEA